LGKTYNRYVVKLRKFHIHRNNISLLGTQSVIIHVSAFYKADVMADNNYITVRKYHDHIVADIIIAALHNAGIDTFSLRDSHSVLPSENVEIKVLASDVEYALEIIEREEGF
jgi:hypothetical protein